MLVAGKTHASENLPHAPFAEWVDLPDRNQFLVTAVYQEAEAYHFWDGNETRYLVDWRQAGEHYGIDINQGYFSVQLGLNDRWAADASLGATTVGWRYFSNFATNGASQSTTGLMDASFGLRYQIFREGEDGHRWRPALTFRVGAVLPDGFDEHFPFAPGVSSTAIEPELLLRKTFGWQGLGFYADALFRWNRTSANDQYVVTAGLFQRIQRWELDFGYRHLQCVAGEDIVYDPATRYITYPRAVREINDSLEAGFSYTTPKRHIRMGFYSRTALGGVNTDQKFWVGGNLTIPFGGVKRE